jgi:chromosome partitioning protein
MLDWLKRKPAAAPGEQPLDSEDQKPLTDERLERLLGRLGPDSRAPREPMAEVLDKPPPSSTTIAAGEPAAESSSESDRAIGTDSTPAEEPAAGLGAADSLKSVDSGVDDGLTLRRGDRTITQRGPGPSAAELLAKGYSFATGPDGKMVIFDAEGNLTDVALPVPSADSGAAGKPAAEVSNEITPLPTPESIAAYKPAAEAVNELAPPPSTDSVETSAPLSEALNEIAPLPGSDSIAASKPAAEAVNELAPPPSTDSIETSAPPAEALDEITPPPRPRKRAIREPAAEALQEITSPPPTGGKAPAAPVGRVSQMRVIAVASQKGGSGKTTIAAHLAVKADAVGQGPVVLIDTDPQGSLAEWWRARAEDTPHLASVRPEALAANLAELRGYGTALAVIDTPPALTGSIEQVIAMADLILIPVRPSPHDLRAAGGTVELARKAGKPFMFIVNSASPRASITAQAVAALSEHGRVAPVILYQRTEYAASMIDGRTVMETAGSGRSAQEIAELWECVYAQIGLRVAA